MATTNIYEHRGYGRSALRTSDFVRRVYTYFTMGIVAAIGGGLSALYLSGSTSIGSGYDVVEIPSAVAFVAQHPFITMAGYFVSFMVASSLRFRPGVNLVALVAYAFVTGLVIAPAVFVAQIAASHGATLDANPVRDAFLLTGAAFAGLTSYAMTTKRDLSLLGSFLNMGLWVLIGASLIGMFFHSSAFQLAISSVAVLIFGGLIVFDTARIVRSGDDSDPVGAALQLFLDVVNLFINLLRILSATSRDR
jgi:modulator of FtsH protease